MQDCDFVDVLFHPVEFRDWKSTAIGFVGKLFGYPTKWVHTSLRISMKRDDGERHEVMHDYTDEGVISYTEPIHRTTGVVRIVVPSTINGMEWLDQILERIEDMHSCLEPLDWWQAVPILKRQEPDKLVCTTFIMQALGIWFLPCHYRSPVNLFGQFEESYNWLLDQPQIEDVLFWRE